MHYRTSRYRTKIRYVESQERKEKQGGAQRMILSDLSDSIGLALIKPQLGYVEHTLSHENSTSCKQELGLG